MEPFQLHVELLVVSMEFFVVQCYQILFKKRYIFLNISIQYPKIALS